MMPNEMSSSPLEQGTSPQTANYAGFWIRFVAFFIDVIIIMIPSYIIFFAELPSLLGLVLGIAYWVYFPSSEYMATPGKMALGLIITDEHGNRIGAGTAAVRYIGYIINAITVGIGFIMIGFTEKKRGLHDMIASTQVVYK